MHLNTLRGIRDVIDAEKASINIEGSPVRMLNTAFRTISGEFPEMLPSWNPSEFFSHRVDEVNQDYYKASSGLAYLAVAIANIEGALSVNTPASAPVTEHRDFMFVSDLALRAVLVRDYEEIQRAFIAGCHKSVIILAGGALEAILLDLLTTNKVAALASHKAPNQHDITQWGLSELTDVAIDMGLITAGAERFSHSVRSYRNLVHPANEVRSGLHFEAEEAKIAIEVLHIVYRDLTP